MKLFVFAVLSVALSMSAALYWKMAIVNVFPEMLKCRKSGPVLIAIYCFQNVKSSWKYVLNTKTNVGSHKVKILDNSRTSLCLLLPFFALRKGHKHMIPLQNCHDYTLAKPWTRKLQEGFESGSYALNSLCSSHLSRELHCDSST